MFPKCKFDHRYDITITKSYGFSCGTFMIAYVFVSVEVSDEALSSWFCAKIKDHMVICDKKHNSL